MIDCQNMCRQSKTRPDLDYGNAQCRYIGMEEKMLNPYNVLVLFVLLLVLGLVGCAQEPIPTSVAPSPALTTPTPAAEAAAAEVARPSNPGGPGPALQLKGDPESGSQVFTNCIPCHGNQGKGGVANPGSSDGTVPSLNPIDPTIANSDPKVFAYNVDLFVEHGSTPDGPNPTFKMPAWGDSKALAPQQIADVIAFVIGLNQ